MSKRIARLRLHELRSDLADYLRGTKVAQLEWIDEFFQCAGHNPDVLKTFVAFTEALGEALPERLSEVVALTVAGVMESDYERNQHEQLCVAHGLAPEWIAAVNRLAPDKGVELTPAERAVQRYALAAVVRRGIDVQHEFEAMLDHISSPEAMAVTVLVGRHVCHALVVNTLRLRPPLPSIFDEEQR